MNRSMIAAAVSMGQLQKKLDTIGNNLANVNTNGYKAREVQFGDLLAQQFENQPLPENEVGRQTPNGIRVGVGARVTETNVRLEMGSIQQSDRGLDLALTKPNQFFQIQTLDANDNPMTNYTRDGAFYVTPAGNGEVELVTANGDRVLGVNGPIRIPDNVDTIKINENGEMVVTYPDNTNDVVAQFEVVEVARPQLLKQAGNNAFSLPNPADLGLAEQDVIQVLDAEDAAVQQFALETSNVDMGSQMTEMLVAQRSYQFNAKSISIADQMMGLVNGLR